MIKSSYAISVVLATLIGFVTPAAAADWQVIESDFDFGLLLNHDSVQVLPKAFSGVDLYMFRWAKAYSNPIHVWQNLPMVAHHIIGVTIACKAEYKGAFVTYEEFKTAGFDTIKKIEPSDFIFGNGPRPISDIQGLATAQKYVCDRSETWRRVHVSHKK